MPLDEALRQRVSADLDHLSEAAANSLPGPSALSKMLESKIAGARNQKSFTRTVSAQESALFTTAAVNMWMRGLHSFLISVSLSKPSPVWASISGYYSSHYSVRAFAHLLGNFRLFNARRRVRIEKKQHVRSCEYGDLTGREHTNYWTIVKEGPDFASDPLFPVKNKEVDVRDFAQYVDHLSDFPTFRPLDRQLLKDRIARISQLPFIGLPPVENSKYSDLDSIQMVAYNRIVRFREVMDEISDVPNDRFWNRHRSPPWVIEFIKFSSEKQGIEPISRP